VCMYVRMYARMHVCMCPHLITKSEIMCGICVYVCTYACMCPHLITKSEIMCGICVYVCTYACMYVFSLDNQI
jgi:hypothetical protein